MANKKKIATSVAAVAMAAAVLVGGTFAWQSISQRALNEASDIVNPGGRLHNDMWYVSAEENNNDIYVENFTDADTGDEIFARVRLEEYMEIVLNHGTTGEKEVPVIGTKTEQTDEDGNTVIDEDGNTVYDYEYVTFTGYEGESTALSSGAADEEGNPYWTWKMGGDTVYMPTFNMNKDSLAADLHGLYVDRVGGISNRAPEQYELANGMLLDENYEGYSEGEGKTANEIWDYDSDTVDEIGIDPVVLNEIITNGDGSVPAAAADSVQLVENMPHVADWTDTAQLISMSAWLEMVDYNVEDDGTITYNYDPDAHGNYWVYDDSADGNGWVYWSAKLGGGETTGLLLDGIKLNQVMDDTWYYAINAVGQFCTPDDTGVAPSGTYNLRAATDTDLTEGTGFYANGETITEQALAFLTILGMTDSTPGYDGGEDGGEDDGSGDYLGMTLYVHVPGQDNANYLIPNKPYDLIVHSIESEDTAVTFTVAEQTWDDETGEEKLVPLTAGDDYTVSTSSAQFEDYTYDYDDTIVKKAEATLTITNKDLVGKYIVVTATGNATGNKTSSESKSVSWEQIDAEILFYEASGEHATPDAGTGYGAQVAAGETYDIVVKITVDGEEYTVYSTCPDDYPVSKKVSVELGEDTTPIINHVQWKAEGNPYEDYQNYTESTINDKGQLVVGDKETYGAVTCVVADDGGTTYYDDLTISATCDVVKIYENENWTADTEPKSIEYATGDWQLYPIGAELLEFDCIYNGEDQQFYTVIAAYGQTAEQMMYVYDGNDNNCTDKVTVTLTGSESTDTKIVKMPADENSGEPYALLTLGSNETATNMTVTAVLDDGSKASATVKVNYVDVLKIGETLPDEWGYITTYSDSELPTTYTLSMVDYRGNTSTTDYSYTFGADTILLDGTKIEGSTLTLGAGEFNNLTIEVSDDSGNEPQLFYTTTVQQDLSATLTASPAAYTYGQETSITLTPTVKYGDEVVNATISEWKLNGNESSLTKLTVNDDGTATLYVDSTEDAPLLQVEATATYTPEGCSEARTCTVYSDVIYLT